jgi:hypothetical protein
MCHIRIFPHSREEFPLQRDLAAWLMTGLRANGGKYLITNRTQTGTNRPDELPAGSVALFRYGDNLLGEAVVRSYTKKPDTDPDDKASYVAKVIFAPSSIRIYSPPVPVGVLATIVGDDDRFNLPFSYHQIDDWTVYPALLDAHMSGDFRVGGIGREGAFV